MSRQTLQTFKILWLFWTILVAGVVIATFGNPLWSIALASLIVSIGFTVWIWTR